MWIEIQRFLSVERSKNVTSLAEVWIEIIRNDYYRRDQSSSLPLRKCGLKFLEHMHHFQPNIVTSLAEVWIEIEAWRSV